MSSLEGLRRNRDLDMGNPEGKDKEGVFGVDKKDGFPSFDEHMNSLRDLMDELPALITRIFMFIYLLKIKYQ